MRLLVVNANTTEAITAQCVAAATAAAAPSTQIRGATPAFGPAVISTRVEEAIAAHAVLEVLARHAGQMDAVLLAVSLDTGLEAARQMLPCPVVGMTEAACFTACMLASRFGLLTLGGVEPYRERIARHGLSDRLSGCLGLALPAQDVLARPEAAFSALQAGIAQLVEQGAEAVLLSGAVLAGMAPALQAAAPVPLLDGIACGVKQAEALVALGLPKPRSGSLAAPAGRASLGVGDALAGLLRG